MSMTRLAFQWRRNQWHGVWVYSNSNLFNLYTHISHVSDVVTTHMQATPPLRNLSPNANAWFPGSNSAPRINSNERQRERANPSAAHAAHSGRNHALQNKPCYTAYVFPRVNFALLLRKKNLEATKFTTCHNTYHCALNNFQVGIYHIEQNKIPLASSPLSQGVPKYSLRDISNISHKSFHLYL